MNCKAALFLLLLPLSAPSQTIHLENGAFQVAGWHPDSAKTPADWASIFTVYVGQQQDSPIIGAYSLENGLLVFRPRYPLAPGLQYRAVFHAPGFPQTEAAFDTPRRPEAPFTKVLGIYPSTSVLPSNTLRMYIYFSAAMGRGEAWQHIHMLDETGSPIELPFLVIDQELWDPAYRRLTLLFDPGRIKRGLVLNEQLGPPIAEGKHYTLVVDRQWRDAEGLPLGDSFRKEFQAGPAERTPPFLDTWRVSAPQAGTTDPLVIDFPNSMDYAMMQRLIEVAGVAGAVAVEQQEKRWRFTPTVPWKPGKYQIVVDGLLEDLAGNRVNRAFDVDRTKPAATRDQQANATLNFEVR